MDEKASWELHSHTNEQSQTQTQKKKKKISDARGFANHSFKAPISVIKIMSSQDTSIDFVATLLPEHQDPAAMYG